MKKLLYVISIVLIVLFGLTFTYKNRQTIELNYYFDLNIQVELSLLLFFTFALGLMVGYLATLLNTFNTRRKLKKAKRDIRALERAIS